MDNLDHDVKEDQYETFVIHRISRCMYELGLFDSQALVDVLKHFLPPFCLNLVVL